MGGGDREVRRDGRRDGVALPPPPTPPLAATVLSCQCFLCRWGGSGAKSFSLSPTHTDTHASLYNGCFTLVPEREREIEMEERGRGRDMVRRREREGGTRGCGGR